MFRQPVRLEEWIALDAAIATDAGDVPDAAVDDAPDDAGGSAETGDDSPFLPSDDAEAIRHAQDENREFWAAFADDDAFLAVGDSATFADETYGGLMTEHIFEVDLDALSGSGSYSIGEITDSLRNYFGNDTDFASFMNLLDGVDNSQLFYAALRGSQDTPIPGVTLEIAIDANGEIDIRIFAEGLSDEVIQELLAEDGGFRLNSDQPFEFYSSAEGTFSSFSFSSLTSDAYHRIVAGDPLPPEPPDQPDPPNQPDQPDQPDQPLQPDRPDQPVPQSLDDYGPPERIEEEVRPEYPSDEIDFDPGEVEEIADLEGDDVLAALTEAGRERGRLEQALLALRDAMVENVSELSDAALAVVNNLAMAGKNNLDSLSEITGLLTGTVGEYLSIGEEYRDGVLQETLDNLVEKTRAQAVETGALAQALENLAAFLSADAASASSLGERLLNVAEGFLAKARAVFAGEAERVDQPQTEWDAHQAKNRW